MPTIKIKCDEALGEPNLWALTSYIADYINEELTRGNKTIDQEMVADAVEAYAGGAR